jgi:toxin ParE1/3/4
VSWYDQQRAGLGSEFVRAVEQAFERTQQMPEAAPIVFRGVRTLELGRFPYGVFYAVTSEYLSVIAVYHASRNPRGWQRRL